MATGTIISLGLYFVVMLGIGLFAYRQTDTNVEGYMLGGRQLGPAVTALSAGASDMSGWMLMGLPGAMYVSGLSAGWIAVGLTLGALANYMLVAPRLRVYTEVANNSITLPDYFENRFADNSRLLRVIASVVIVIFLPSIPHQVLSQAVNCLKPRLAFPMKWDCMLLLALSLPIR